MRQPSSCEHWILIDLTGASRAPAKPTTRQNEFAQAMALAKIFSRNEN